MYDHWNLDAFYTGTDDPSFKADMESFKTSCAQLEELAASVNVAEPSYLVKQYIKISEDTQLVLLRLFGYLELRRAVNARDTESATYTGKMLSLLSSASGANAVISKHIGALEGLDEIIDSDEILKEYSYYLHNLQSDARFIRSGSEEEIMAKYGMSGGRAWEDLRDYVTSSVSVDYESGTTTLSDIRNKAYDDSREVRKKAYEAELKCYDKIKDAVCFALNSIKLQTINECKIRGYASPLDRTLYLSRMERSTLDALLAAMREYMPKFREYLKAKAQALGYDGGLPWYELFAPMGDSGKDFTPEDAHKYLLDVFTPFDTKLSDMIDRAFRDEWIDFFPADGKQGGAFCMSAYTIKQSRVLTNFGGKFGDVMTLAHELGHAFHNVNLYSHRPLNTEYSMPVAETASNFNEVVVMDYALSHAENDREKLALIENKLQDTTQIICDIYSRYLFETYVFENREEEFMFPDKLNELMLKAQTEAFGDGIDGNFMHPYMWACKSHYYSADLSFYNFPYAFGGLFAQGLFAKYKKEGQSFVPLYEKLLHATTVCSVEDTAAIAGIDLSDINFWRSGLDYFAKMIDEFCALAKKAK